VNALQRRTVAVTKSHDADRHAWYLRGILGAARPDVSMQLPSGLDTDSGKSVIILLDLSS
jgi:hypothetical protein